MNEVEMPLTLYALNAMVRSSLKKAMPEQYWVVGELSEVRETAVGHCYIELVERGEREGELLAKARGNIWSNRYSLIKPYFLEQTGERFKVGLKVMLKVSITFHELYGYSLDVCDIEPSYTIGDMALRRRQIIKRLTDEGVIDLNKELPFPRLPQRIAVISSSSAAGYGDFCNQLMENAYGLVFYPHLFAAPMQGAKVEQGIIAALNRIAAHCEEWDVVVIIRGGGATSDLSCFDSYDLANNCAQFPIPIITGIGHQRDDTILDLVSHTRVKTPTAAAELLIHALAAEAACVDDMCSTLLAGVQNRMATARMALQGAVQRLPVATALYMQQQRHRIEMIEQRISAASPERILSLGYSLTTYNGRSVRSAGDLPDGCEVTTYVADGNFTSIVNKKTK